MLEGASPADNCRMGEAGGRARSAVAANPVDHGVRLRRIRNRPTLSRSLWTVVLVAGTVLVSAAAQGATSNISGAVPSSPQQQAFPGTGFGGYNWYGPVSQISASWRVPAIDHNSMEGHASTWVGAQPREGGTPFIQLGTVEDDWGENQITYQGFWSDTVKDFHPQMIGTVKPGDLISVSMVREKDDWELSFDDLTSHRSHDLTIQYGAGTVPNQAEWLQEDPTPGDVTATDLPYPSMSAPTFEDLRVNRTTPKLSQSEAKVLFPTNGGFLVPTSVRSDSFTFNQPQGLALAYLVQARHLDAVGAQFAVAQVRWRTLSQSERLSAAEQIEQGYTSNLEAFKQLKFPASDEPALNGLETHLQDTIADLQTWTQSGLNLTGPTFAALGDDQMTVHDFADQIRADVGLPPA